MSEKGVTLIEMVLIIVLIGIIGVIATDTFLYSSKSVLTANAVREATQVNRVAMDRMIREIRNVRNNQCVATATPTTFSFVDPDNNTITYSLSGGSLVRTQNVTPNTLVNNVSSLAFSYFNNADPPADITAGPPATCAGANLCSATCPTPTNIWLVQIDLTTQSGTETMRLRSQAHPRSF